jgi:hypothetical protein
MPSASSVTHRRWRYSELNWLRKIVNSQARMLVPGWNWSIWVKARTIVSCTRSSARSLLAVSETANARSRGTVARISWRNEAVSVRLLCGDGDDFKRCDIGKFQTPGAATRRCTCANSAERAALAARRQ